MYNILTFENVLMDNDHINQLLQGLPLGAIRCFDSLDSTNSEAERWLDQGAPDMALVLADEQTQGRGRLGRRWLTKPGTALAFSLVIKASLETDSQAGPDALAEKIMWFTGLGAVAVCEALNEEYSLPAQIKWPNDILLSGRKTAGVLTEAIWQGSQPTAVILGIGINVASESVPPDEAVRFPATSVQNAVGRPVERYALLRATLEKLIAWYHKIDRPEFLQAWDDRLAFKNEWVNIVHECGMGQVSTRQARLIGIDEHGRLKLYDRSGSEFRLVSGELSLRAL